MRVKYKTNARGLPTATFRHGRKKVVLVQTISTKPLPERVQRYIDSHS